MLHPVINRKTRELTDADPRTGVSPESNVVIGVTLAALNVTTDSKQKFRS
jgi:hypothetical protein